MICLLVENCEQLNLTVTVRKFLNYGKKFTTFQQNKTLAECWKLKVFWYCCLWHTWSVCKRLDRNSAQLLKNYDFFKCKMLSDEYKDSESSCRFEIILVGADNMRFMHVRLLAIINWRSFKYSEIIEYATKLKFREVSWKYWFSTIIKSNINLKPLNTCPFMEKWFNIHELNTKRIILSEVSMRFDLLG